MVHEVKHSSLCFVRKVNLTRLLGWEETLLHTSEQESRMKYVLSGIAAFVLFVTTAAAMSNDDLSRNLRRQTIQVAALIDKVFHDFSTDDRKTIKVICDCESGGQNARGGPNGLITHVDKNGRLVTNRSTGAAGACQIYKAAHSSHFWAKQQLDPANVLENLQYMRALIQERQQRGQSKFADWKASKKCWQQPTAHQYSGKS